MISYAQNFEDVMLWRALHDMRPGFYVDIGAYDPTQDSVTRWFYDQGWSGINVEPAAEPFARLAAARPRDVNVRAAIGASEAPVRLRVIPGSGLSTTNATFAETHREQGWSLGAEEEVPGLTLDGLLDRHASGRVVDFLKVDAEGSEAAILCTAAFDVHRPRILVVEATEPNSTTPSWDAWEPHLLSRRYAFVWFDGLNRFYLREEDAPLARHFQLPPNLHDHFCLHAVAAARAEAAALGSELAAARAEIAALRASTSWRITEPLRRVATAMRGR